MTEAPRHIPGLTDDELRRLTAMLDIIDANRIALKRITAVPKRYLVDTDWLAIRRPETAENSD